MPKDRRAGAQVYWTQSSDVPDTLLIHCSLAHQGAWRPLIGAAELSAIAFDMPGHGRSADWGGQSDYQAQTTEIAASFCDSPLHLIGHSFGATVALRLALEHPECVCSLTLIEPVFFAAARGTPEFDAHEETFAPFVAAMESGDRPLAARLFTEIWGSGLPWTQLPETQRRYITERIHLVPAGAPAIHADNANQLAHGRLENLDCRTLLIRGDRSDAVTKAINDTLASRLPKARSIVVKGAGHMGPITHPQLYAAPIRVFRETL